MLTESEPHYRQPLPWTDSLIAQAKATLDGLYRKAREAETGEVDEGVLDAPSMRGSSRKTCAGSSSVTRTSR